MDAKRVAVVGGDERVERTPWPRSHEVTCYQSSKFGGDGQLTRLKNALAANKYDIVVLLTRWIGHSMTACVRNEAKCKVVFWPTGYGALAKALKEGKV
jgi:hypothetical protein